MENVFEEEKWSWIFSGLLDSHTQADAAHDANHIRRVVANARCLAAAEGADWTVVMPAAWLHDCVAVPKSSTERHNASRLSAARAVEWLVACDWPHGRLEDIAHAIEAHSFSAGIAPRTPEAMVVQDADRLDALGAVGLARTLMLGGEMGRGFYDQADPFCKHRRPDDSIYTIDHLYSKLLTLEAGMRTVSGRAEATRRTAFLRMFLDQLENEIGGVKCVSGVVCDPA